MTKAGTRKKTAKSPILLIANSWRSRRLPRYPADLRIRIALARPRPVILYGRTSDLSTGGVRAVVPHQIEDGAVVMIELKLPQEDGVLWLPARLRHRSGFRCGFQFVEVDARQRLLIRRLLSALGR